MARTPAPRSPWRDLLATAWRMPLASAPFALFFLLLGGRPLSAFGSYYLAALVFSVIIGLANWATAWFLVPRLVFEGDSRAVLKSVLAHVAASLLGSGLSAFTLNATIVPGFLGGPRGVVVFGIFSLLFTALFAGLITAWQLWRRALERAKSEQELQLARRIQRSFLLSEFPAHPRLDVHAVNLSSREVSGDFYDVVPAGPEAFLVAVADVSGKGVPAALLSSMLQAALRTQATTVPSVAAMMTTINSLVCQRETTGQFATFFLARIHEPTLTLTYTNAGHNFPIVFRAGGHRVLLEDGGLVVGMMESMPYSEASIGLQPGDRVVLYTDGVTEAQGPGDEMFGEERLMALVESLPAELSAEQLVNGVIDGLRRFLGEREAGDDVTLLALRVPGDPPR